MATTNWIVLAFGWSVKYFFAPNSPMFRKNLDKRQKQIAKQLQNVMLYKQTQQEKQK